MKRVKKELYSLSDIFYALDVDMIERDKQEIMRMDHKEIMARSAYLLRFMIHEYGLSDIDSCREIVADIIQAGMFLPPQKWVDQGFFDEPSRVMSYIIFLYRSRLRKMAELGTEPDFNYRKAA